MPTQHKNITEVDLHESKGASTAAVNTVAVADGAGSATWGKIQTTTLEGVSSVPDIGYFAVSDGAGGFVFAPSAHGSCYFSNFGTPYSLAATTSYQKIAATTIASGASIAFTENTDTSLTYTGTSDIHLDIVFQASYDQSTGSDKDIYTALYKNGVIVAGGEVALTTVSGQKVLSSMHRDIHATTGDIFTLYCKVSAAATVNFYTLNLMASTAGT